MFGIVWQWANFVKDQDPESLIKLTKLSFTPLLFLLQHVKCLWQKRVYNKSSLVNQTSHMPTKKCGMNTKKVLAWGPLLFVNMLGNFAPLCIKINCEFNQLIHFAPQDFEMKDAYRRETRVGAGTTQTQTSGTKEKEKNCSVTFPNILFGSWRRRGNHR